ncbi:MAG: hypothetical protein ACI8TX_004032 [Hyphomicrobiaceae bacterium]|jgi:hypothetical protein
MYPLPPRNHQPFIEMERAIGPHREFFGSSDLLAVLPYWLGLGVVLWAVHLALKRVSTGAAIERPAPVAWSWPRASEIGLCFGLFVVAAWLRMNEILVEPLEMQEASELYPIFQTNLPLPSNLSWLSWFVVVFIGNKMEPHQFLFPVSLLPFRDLVLDVRLLRYIPAFFGALAVPVAYWLGRVSGFPRREVAIAALALTLAPFHVYFSRAVLPYTLTNITVVAVGIALCGYMTPGSAPSSRRRWAFVLSLMAAISSHYGAVPLAALSIGTALLIVGDRRNRVFLLRDTVFAGLCYLPFSSRGLIYALQPNSLSPHQLLMDVEMFVDRPFVPELLAYIRYALASVFGVISQNPSPVVQGVAALAFGLTFIAGAFVIVRRSRSQIVAVLVPGLFFLLFLTLIGPIGVYQKQQGVYFPPRRLVLLYPYVLLISTAGFFALTSWLGRNQTAWRAVVLVPALAFFASGALRTHYEATIPDGTALGQALREELKPNDGVLVGPSTWMRWAILYGLLGPEDPRWIAQLDTPDFFSLDYEGHPFPAERPADAIMINMPETLAFAETHLQRERLSRVWLIHLWQDTAGYPEIVEDHDHQATLRRLLSENFEARRVIEERNVTATLYERVSRLEPPAEGYEVDLGAMGHPFVSLTWPPPPVPVESDHARHLLVGGRIDVPLPGPGEWSVDVEMRLEKVTNSMALTFLTGPSEGPFGSGRRTVSGDWRWVDTRIVVEDGDELPTFVLEFRGDDEPQPMATDESRHFEEMLFGYVRGTPLQIRGLRVRRVSKGKQDGAPYPGLLWKT